MGKDFFCLQDFRLAAAQQDTAKAAVAVTEKLLHPWIAVAGVLIQRKVITRADLSHWLLLPLDVVHNLLRTPPPPLTLPSDRALAQRLRTAQHPTQADLKTLRTILADLAHIWRHATESQRTAHEYFNALLSVHRRIPDRYIAVAIGKTHSYVRAHRDQLGIAS